jgi:hypothetical protein
MIRITISVRCLMLGCFLATLTAFGALPNVQVGFDGFFKANGWFPVTVGPMPDATLTEISLVGTEYRAGGPRLKVMGRFGVEPNPTGGWRSLAYLSQRSHGNIFLRSTFVFADGRETTLDTPLQGLESEATLILVVTETPEHYTFMRMLEHGQRRLTRVVAASPELLHGRDWRDLQGVDAVILDGPAAREVRDQQALHDWITLGGNVILTDRAIRNGATTWGLAADAQDSPYQEMPGDALARILPDTDALLTFRRKTIRPEGFTAIVSDGEGMLIGVRELGRGRIVTLGFDWQSLAPREPAQQERIRRDTWTFLLHLLRDKVDTLNMPTSIVTPREAQVKTLMWPILGFLLVCALLLGPVNRVVLARMRRQECMVLTLPAGALILSILALFAGLLWRPSHVIVEEMLITVADKGGATWTHGAYGIFSPGERKYNASLPRPAVLLRESHLHSWGYYGGELTDPDVIYAQGSAASSMDELAIARWSMRFLQATEPAAAPGLEAWATAVDTNRIEGVVVNTSESDLLHVNVVFQQFRVPLGDLPAGTRKSFVLDLMVDDAHLGERCSGCGGYHHRGDPFAARKGEPPLPPAMEALGHSATTWAQDNARTPVVIGLIQNGAPNLEISPHRTDTQHRTAQLLTTAVTMQWESPLHVPDGFAHTIGLPHRTPETEYKPDQQDAFGLAHLRRVPVRYQPHVLAIRDAYAAFPALGQIPEVDASNPPLRSEAFILPAWDPENSSIRLAWEIPEREEDETGAEEELALEIFHWPSGSWHELARATTGSHHVSFTSASGYLLSEEPVLALRQRLLSTEAAPQLDAMLPHQQRNTSRSLNRASILLTVLPQGGDDAE